MPGPPIPFPGFGAPTIISTSTPGSGGISGGVLTVVNDSGTGVHGFITVAVTPVGSNDVVAANVALGLQALQNQINWILWRLPDFYQGGTFNYPGNQLNLGAVINFTGACFISQSFEVQGSGSAIIFDTGTFLTALSGSTINASGFVNFNGTSATHVKSGATWLFDSGSVTTVGGQTTYLGINAWRANRKTSRSADDPTFAAQSFDTVWLYNSGGSPLYITLTDPNAGTPLPEGIRCTFVVPGQLTGYQPQNTASFAIKDHTGFVIAAPTYNALNPGRVTIETTLISGTVYWEVVEHV